MVKMPVIPGHEVGAVIEEIGEGVPEGFHKGMAVTVNPYTNCGKCASCRNGRVNACEHNETLGVQRNGSMQEYLVLPWNKVIPANGLSAKECALIEPMSVGFHAVSRGQVTDIDTVAVIGCGMIGLGAIVRASLRGASVIAIDLDDEKLDYDRMFRLMVSGYKSIALPPPPSWFEPYKDQCKQSPKNKALEEINELKKQGGCPPPQKFKEAADKLRRKVEAMQYIHEQK